MSTRWERFSDDCADGNAAAVGIATRHLFDLILWGAENAVPDTAVSSGDWGSILPMILRFEDASKVTLCKESLDLLFSNFDPTNRDDLGALWLSIQAAIQNGKALNSTVIIDAVNRFLL